MFSEMVIKILLFVCGCIPLFAAGPIVHLWVAERFCEIYDITDPSIVQEVMVGTEYPDIRYITRNPRSWTHLDVADIRDVLESKTPFEAGMKLHAWVDIVRETYIADEVYEAVVPYHEGHPATLLKFIEEEIMADIYDGRQWSSYFNDILQEEYLFAEKDAILKWHNLIQWTMSVRPSWILWAQSYKGPAFGASVDTLYTWSYLLPNLQKETIFKEHLEGLMEHILEELQRYPRTLIKFGNTL